MSMKPAKLRAVVLEWVEQIRHGSGGSDEDAIEIIRTIGALDRRALLDLFRMMDEGEEAEEIVGSAMAGGTPRPDAIDARPTRAAEAAKKLAITREDQGPDRVFNVQITKETERPANRHVSYKRTTPGLESWTPDPEPEPEPIKPISYKRTTPGLESWGPEETTKSVPIVKVDPEGTK